MGARSRCAYGGGCERMPEARDCGDARDVAVMTLREKARNGRLVKNLAGVPRVTLGWHRLTGAGLRTAASGVTRALSQSHLLRSANPMLVPAFNYCQ